MLAETVDVGVADAGVATCAGRALDRDGPPRCELEWRGRDARGSIGAAGAPLDRE